MKIGIFNKTAKARDSAIIAAEKEQIILAWNSLIISKNAEMINEIDKNNFETELNNNGNNTQIDYIDNNPNNNFLIKFLNTNHEYIVTKNGDISLNTENTSVSPIVLSKIKSWSNNSNTDFHNSNIKSTIKQIEFVNYIPNPLNINDSNCWDVSEEGDNSIIAWLEDIDNSEYKKLFIGGNNGVKANENSSFIFYDFINLENINFNNYYDTSSVTNMQMMFANCYNIESLDLRSFNTSSVTNMIGMFGGYKSQTGLTTTSQSIMALNNLDVSSFDTNNVTTMALMFLNCGNIKTLNLSNFNTSKVTNMQDMFNMPNDYSSILETITLGDMWYTSNVTNMECMFFQCSNLKTIYVTHDFDISSVSKSSQMFSDCPKLIGGNGTTGNSLNYAKIDKDDQKGLFTDIRSNLEENNQQIDYIESDGNQYILTDIIPTNTTGIYAKLSSSNISSDSVYFGSKKNNNSRFWIGNYNNKIYYGWNSNTYRATEIEKDKTYILKMNYLNNRKEQFDDELILNISEEFNTYNNYSFNIFAGNIGSASYKSSIRLYEFKISEGTNIAYDFVPVFNKITSSTGLYDKIHKKFYPNCGSSKFISPLDNL